ncbi:hypothetical protein BDR26DRAFT_848984 [Obelidium mucronatum]|nr:hypothetical protein BDR26DRAFT_848984 [Obelidium mucronatum]
MISSLPCVIQPRVELEQEETRSIAAENISSGTKEVRNLRSRCQSASNEDHWAYRAYISTAPCANKIIQLKSVTHSVDTQEPPKYKHLTDRARKQRTAIRFFCNEKRELSISKYPKLHINLSPIRSRANSVIPGTFASCFPRAVSARSSVTAPCRSKSIKSCSSLDVTLAKEPDDIPKCPPRFSPRVPTVPRVATIRPKSAPTQRAEKLKNPRTLTSKSVPLIPRVAIIAAQKQKEQLERDLLQIRKSEAPSRDYCRHLFGRRRLHEELFISSNATCLTPLGLQLTKEKTIYRSGMDEEQYTTALITGAALKPSFVLRDPKSYLCKVYVSVVDGKFLEARTKVKQNLVPELRSYCMASGIEFQWNDITCGMPEVVNDIAHLRHVQRWYLESSLKDSMCFNHVAFFDPSEYGKRAIPTEIDEAVWQLITVQLEHLDRNQTGIQLQNTTPIEFLHRWYVLDNNCTPPQRVLRTVSSVVPGFPNASSCELWQESIVQLHEILKVAAVKLGRNGLLESATVQRFIQSNFQDEIIAGIVKQSRRGDWLKSLLCVSTEFDPVLHGECSKEDKRLNEKLSEYLYTSVPYENRVEQKPPNANKLCEKIKHVIQERIFEISQSQKKGSLYDEILFHTTQFKLRAKDHKFRTHLTEKIINYISRTDAVPLPPLIVVGEKSMGKSAVIAKSLEKYAKRLTNYSNEQSTLSSMKRNDSSTSLSSNATSVNTVCTANTIEMKALVQRHKLSTKNIQTISMNPVIVSRIIGISPNSSSSHLLMKSIAHQICIAYNIPTNMNDDISLDMFREALKFATIDAIPPFVRIVLSANESRVICFLQERIKVLGPMVLAVANKGGPPPSQTELDSTKDLYVVKVGGLIPPVAKAWIKQYNDAHSRRLTPGQEEIVRNAFSKSIELLCEMTMSWDSTFSSVEQEIPKSIKEALEVEIVCLEQRYGRDLTSMYFSSLALSQEGLTQSEIFDLLSLESSHDTREYHIYGLIYQSKQLVLRRNSWGGELFSICFDKDLLEVVANRYMGCGETQKFARVLADYFSQFNFKQKSLCGLEFVEGFLSIEGVQSTCDGIQREVLLANTLTAFLEELFKLLLRNREILNQCPPSLIGQVLANQLIQLPQKHPLYSIFESGNVLTGPFSCLPHWLTKLELTESEYENPADTPLYYQKSDENSYVLQRKIKGASIKSVQCSFDGSTSPQKYENCYIRPAVMLFHDNHTTISVSPDGYYIASGASDGKLKLFKGCTHINTVLFPGQITGLHFQPSFQNCSHLLICLSNIQEQRLISWSLSKEIGIVSLCGVKHGLKYGLVSSGYMTNSKGESHQQAFGLNFNGVLTIWNLSTETIIKNVFPEPEDNGMFLTGQATVSSDGLFVAFGVRGIRVLSSLTLAVVWSQKLHSIDPMFGLHSISHLKFCKTSSIVVVSEKQAEMNILGSEMVGKRYEQRSYLQVFECTLNASVESLAVIEDFSLIAIGQSNGNIEAISHAVTAINHIPNPFLEQQKHYQLVVGSVDGVIKIIDFQDKAVKLWKGNVCDARCSNDGNYLIASGVSVEKPICDRSNENIGLVDNEERAEESAPSVPSSSSKKSLSSLKKGDSELSSMSKSVTFALSTKCHVPKETDVTIWDVNFGTRILSIPLSADIIWCDFEYSLQGISSFVTGEQNGVVKIWDWDAVKVSQESLRPLIGEISFLELHTGRGMSNKLFADLNIYPTSIDLWNLDTGDKLHSIGLNALPFANGLATPPILQLSWSQSSPRYLVAGVDRLAITPHEIQNLLDNQTFIKEKLGSDIAARCTAACQSIEDPSVMLIGVCDVVYWISSETEDKSPLDQNPSQNDIPYFIRRISTPAGETIISLYHLKTLSVDAVLVATDFGTVAVYDLTLQRNYFQNSSAHNIIHMPAPLVALWTNLCALTGMHVKNISPQNEDLNKWRLILAGRNGFITVLDLEL